MMEHSGKKKIATWCTFWPKFKKKLKKFLLFSQKRKLFVYFRKRIFLIFQETDLSYISGNVNPKKLLIFQEVTFRARKVKRTKKEPTLKMFLIFQEIKLSTPKISRPLRTFHHCFFMCFRFFTRFSPVFSVFSLIAFFHVTNFLYYACFLQLFYQVLRFVLLYRMCYGFERAFSTLRRFLPYTPSPDLPQYCEHYGFERAFSTLSCFLPYTLS